MAKFTVLGMGGFGLALAVMLNNFNHEVTVWSAFDSEMRGKVTIFFCNGKIFWQKCHSVSIIPWMRVRFVDFI